MSCGDAQFHASQLKLGAGWCWRIGGLVRRVAANPSLAVVPGSLECGCVRGCSPAPRQLSLHGHMTLTLLTDMCPPQRSPSTLRVDCGDVIASPQLRPCAAVTIIFAPMDVLSRLDACLLIWQICSGGHSGYCSQKT